MGICQELFFFFSDFCLILKYVNWSTGGFLKCCFWQRLGERIEFLHGIMQLTLRRWVSHGWLAHLSSCGATSALCDQQNWFWNSLDTLNYGIFVEIFGKINSFERNKIEILSVNRKCNLTRLRLRLDIAWIKSCLINHVQLRLSNLRWFW